MKLKICSLSLNTSPVFNLATLIQVLPGTELSDISWICSYNPLNHSCCYWADTFPDLSEEKIVADLVFYVSL